MASLVGVKAVIQPQHLQPLRQQSNRKQRPVEFPVRPPSLNTTVALMRQYVMLNVQSLISYGNNTLPDHTATVTTHGIVTPEGRLILTCMLLTVCTRVTQKHHRLNTGVNSQVIQ